MGPRSISDVMQLQVLVKDHSDSEKGNLLPPHRLLLSINSKGSFICTIPQTGLGSAFLSFLFNFTLKKIYNCFFFFKYEVRLSGFVKIIYNTYSQIPYHKQSLCYTSRGALAGMRNSSMFFF